uniref:NACHT LRR and PYD domain-containing protein n=1 Tax=Astyanax mexicanus TaxID=7994 RepID=A0A3B1IZ66_ASTMX
MCHIPVFCWISATVLQNILEETENEETPKTLTGMYTCFLIFQTVQGNKKYSGKNALDIPWDKEAILQLSKLAFQHLEENSLIFYEDDLKSCGIDPSEISVYSGLCTQETVRFLATVFSFVHLSIQEFLAALFAYLLLRNDNRNVFEPQSTSQESRTTELIDFLKTAVDKALESEHGHLDLFLRFLLGLSLESNEKLIRGLLNQTGSSSDCRKEIVEYIKIKFKENPSSERSINLFYCLNELNDDSLVKEIQSYMNSGRLSEFKLSPAQWSALVFVLLTSKEKLDEFDLKKFIRSDECLNRLLSVVQEASSALLSDCNLTEKSCSALFKVLSSQSSKLTLLDMSYNPIQDFGVDLLSEGLKIYLPYYCFLCTIIHSIKKFESCTEHIHSVKYINICENYLFIILPSIILCCSLFSLSFCSITEKGYSALASALNSSSPLIELDLRGNDPGDTGVKIITDLLRHKGRGTCKLNELSITEEGCAALSSALCLNPSHLIELDLTENKLGNSGVTKLCELLNNQSCKLQRLRIADCCITEKGYADLASALESNPSSTLTELDLRGNDPGEKGVQLLTDLEMNENRKLKTLSNSNITEQGNSDVTEKGCATLSAALCSNPSHLIELDLSENVVGNSGVKHLCDLLNNQYHKLLSFCSVTEKGYEFLASALKNPALPLIELDLRGNDPGDTGVKNLQKPHQDAEKLNSNSITEEGCGALSSALGLNPSHLIDLDLSENNLGIPGVKELCSFLNKTECKLQNLR